MEFNEKLQQLRKQKNLTQEELATMLYVSRTAISKWESGRGYPSIDSLKAISKLFSVSVDDLLSGDELISLAQTEQTRKTTNMRDLVFGMLDCMMILLCLLPFFAQTQPDGFVKTVPLYAYIDNRYIQMIYACLFALITLFGVAQFALQTWQHPRWLKGKARFSLGLTVLTIILTLLNRQPYPGVFLLSILVMKGFLLLKRS